MTTLRILLAAGLLCAAPGLAPALAQDGTVIEGPATMIDADIVKIGDARIILWGVDAPEKRQQCQFTGSQEWNCFEPASREMQLLIEAGPWTCTQQGDIDRFKNTYAICEVAGVNVNADLVRKGLAVAYTDQTDAYEADQDAAKADKIGLWQEGSTFHEPWAYRGAMTPGGYR